MAGSGRYLCPAHKGFVDFFVVSDVQGKDGDGFIRYVRYEPVVADTVSPQLGGLGR
jgi:hypothetical protein